MNNEVLAELKDHLDNWLNKQLSRLISAERNAVAGVTGVKELRSDVAELKRQVETLQGLLASQKQENDQLKQQIFAIAGSTVGPTT